MSVIDALPQVIWSWNFLRYQWYQVNKSIIYQYNQSTIRICNNGRASSSRRTRHIAIRYFFITEHIKSKEFRVEYCHADDMIAYFFGKSLQSAKFTKFRNFILNVQEEI